ncbi:MAG: NADH-quinone oxidoreductase subunit K [Chloroflexi bacterium]|nr:NADH-quinone oxidoreductase subunit K [Chloroflexota bacterium]
MTISSTSVLWISVFGLFGIGLYGLLVVRNLFQLIVGLQILVKGAVLALVVAGRMSGQLMLAQSVAVTVIVADTAVAVIGLALAIQIKRRVGTLDVKALSTLRR